jgi:RNA polymerase sigma-70 factor, ECF subfamily
MGDRSLALTETPLPCAGEQGGATPGDRIQAAVIAHFDFLWRTIRRLGVEPGTVDDAAQEVFIVANKGIAEVPVGKERSYLFAIALRVAAQKRRTQRRRREVSGHDALHEVTDAAKGPDELLDECRARQVMDQILESLPLEQRAVFVLFEMEEMTTVQIAEMLDIPAGTVASRLRRSRELFMKAVNRRWARDARAGA